MKTQIKVPAAQQHCSIRNIAMFGSADVDERHPLYLEVFKVARYLAYHGKVIVNGGGPGVMAAATLGARAAGGETIAVTFYPKDMPEFEGRFAGNIVDKEIKTANYIERMFGLMDQADAFICFQGGTGTLSEWSTAWLLAHLYYGNHKPLILYGEFWHKVMDVISEHFFIGETEQSVYAIANNEEELITLLEKFENQLADRCGLPPRNGLHHREPSTQQPTNLPPKHIKPQYQAPQRKHLQVHNVEGRVMQERVVKKTIQSLLHKTKHGFAQKGKLHLRSDEHV